MLWPWMITALSTWDPKARGKALWCLASDRPLFLRRCVWVCSASSSLGSGCELSRCRPLKCFYTSKSPELHSGNLQKLSPGFYEQKLPWGSSAPCDLQRQQRTWKGLMSWSSILPVKNEALLLHLQCSHQFSSQSLRPLRYLWDRFKTKWQRSAEDINRCVTTEL